LASCLIISYLRNLIYNLIGIIASDTLTRIEKLEIQGFKSFAKKTVLTFPSNFSVICGPNGSGKSNILDALCFVLGRTSAKSLRADKMLETIFHGTKKKPAAEFAKITLWFDNSSREFPFEEDKITLSRKINSKGVSIYRLNGKTETRETIQEILRPAQIKPDGHNIILQGDITEIIEMNPVERREIIDEISGISEFDDKRNKAQRELITVEDRLKESHILLNEKHSNIEKLENEKKSAQDYQKLTVELDKLRASLAKIRLQEAEDAMGKLDGKISEISSGSMEKEVDGIDREIERLEKRRDELSKKLFDRSKDIAIIREAERLRTEISRKRDRIDMGKTEISRIDEMVSKLEMLKQKETESSGGRIIQDILKLGRTGIYGTVASLSSVPSEYQTAIEVAAGAHLYDIVVSDQNVAIECVNHLKKNKLGRATFLPLDKIRPRNGDHLSKLLKQDGVIGVAIDLIEFNAKYFNAFSFVLGDTLIVDRIETARKLGVGEARYVTLDGDLVERSGAIIGGFYTKKRAFTDTEDVKNYVIRRELVEKEIRQMEKELVLMTESLDRLTAQEETGSNELTEMQKERDDVELEYDSLRNKRKRMFDEKINSQEEINKLRIRKARLEAELDNLKSEFENYKKSETYEMSPSILETNIRETMESINILGAINMKALEEFNQQKAIFDELKEKVDKLIDERNKILEIIADVEGRRKDVFTKTLEGVREQFKRVFHDLMKSDADLRLVGGLDSGLIIEASTKGNKMTNIDAMSGGEKTLTAMAFLFAIQRFKPAPFYILDEIDAALDKPNTKKIVELIKKYMGHSQFIVITHNEATIQEAGCVYGVSMDEGESNLIGIRMPG
jgi:chromosome segregation protein